MTCEFCGEPLMWSTSRVTGQRVAINAEFGNTGNMVLFADGTHGPAATQRVGDSPFGQTWEHFAVCSARHRALGVPGATGDRPIGARR